jgi:outer membrane protein assembly factor BamB
VTPAVRSGRVVITTADDMLRCLDATSGAPLWSVHVGDSSNKMGLRSSPLLAGRTVVVAHDTSVDARDLSTGALLWTASLGASGEWASPSGANGLVFVEAGNDTLQAFDIAGCGAPACTARWTAATGSPGGTEGVKGAVIAGGSVYTPTIGMRCVVSID